MLKIRVPSWAYNNLLHNFVYVSVTCTVFDSQIKVYFQTAAKFRFKFSRPFKVDLQNF